eukprot:756401-Hanusia_phi.AAC.1
MTHARLPCRWYKNKEGEKTGPLPLDLLEALWISGEIDGLTAVWKEGMEDYASISAVEELRSYFQSIADEDEEEGDGECEADEMVDQDGRTDIAHVVSSSAQVVRLTGKQLWDMQWTSSTTAEGATYYANKYTFESSWEAPQAPAVPIALSALLPCRHLNLPAAAAAAAAAADAATFDEEEAALVRAPWMLCWTAKGGIEGRGEEGGEGERRAERRRLDGTTESKCGIFASELRGPAEKVMNEMKMS